MPAAGEGPEGEGAGVSEGGSAKAEPAAVQESEHDAPEDSRPRSSERVCFPTHDATVNVVPSDIGGVLMALREGGCKYLAAGARANVGIKSGRYMFEVRVVEDVSEIGNVPSKSSLRVGFSLKSTSSFVGDSEDSIGFDSEGHLVHNKIRKKVTSKGSRGSVLALVLNVDAGSPNANTLSLFIDGERAVQPQPLPTGLTGKPLYPTVTFKSMSVHVNFGPAPCYSLPFRCLMMEDAAEADLEVQGLGSQSGQGRHEVLFPIFLPDQGTFDWLDRFTEKNPQYTELSDRATVEWALRSNLVRNKSAWKHEPSNDKPGMGFSVPMLDDGSAQRSLARFAPMQPRDYVVMEVQGNLLKDDRMAATRRFASPVFKRVAQVMIGEPDEDFKQHTRQLILKDKQEELDKEHALKTQAALRAKLAEQQKKKALKLEKERKRKAELVQHKRERAKKMAKGEPVDEDMKEDEPPAEEEEEPEEDVKMGDGAKGSPAPKAELDDEDMELWFRKRPTQGASGVDVSKSALTGSIGKFSLPEEGEGFDEIRYSWYPAAKVAGYFREWVLEQKKTMPVEDIQPSDWFKRKRETWIKDVQSWQALQKTKQAGKPLAAAKENSKDNAEMDPAQLVKEELHHQSLDVFGVDDIRDIGDGTALFKDFELEDWAILTLRFELHLMVHALQRDCTDPDRKAMRVDQLAHYYTKYYKKFLNPKNFGFETVEVILEYIEDTVVVNPDCGVLESLVDADHASNGIFVKLTEECRRSRQRRVLLGEDGVLRPNLQPPIAVKKIAASATTPWQLPVKTPVVVMPTTPNKVSTGVPGTMTGFASPGM